MSDTVERFSNRVENYSKFRPGYPPEMMRFFNAELGLTPASTVADIGSGTGLSSKPFLEKRNLVYGIEPNAAMRAAAEIFLREYANFRSIDGTAEATGLPDNAVDIIVAAQAFHWFRPDETREEFKRILRPGGYICLIWNERQLDTTAFLREYEQFLLKFARDYEKVRHENIDETKLAAFFGKPFKRASFANQHVHDFDGLRGRMLSSSYMPSETDPVYVEMIAELDELFAKHERDGRITILYDTNVFYTQL